MAYPNDQELKDELEHHLEQQGDVGALRTDVYQDLAAKFERLTKREREKEVESGGRKQNAWELKVEEAFDELERENKVTRDRRGGRNQTWLVCRPVQLAKPALKDLEEVGERMKGINDRINRLEGRILALERKYDDHVRNSIKPKK